MMIARRGFLTGLTAALCAPAIIRTPGLIMPVKAIKVPRTTRVWIDVNTVVDRNTLLQASDYAGQPVMMFRGIPITLTDEIVWQGPDMIHRFGVPA
jgi:hypothetical protein